MTAGGRGGPVLPRRRVLGLIGIAGAAAGVGLSLPALSRQAQTGNLLPSRLPLPKPFQVPLPIPPVLVPVRHPGFPRADYYEITQRAARQEIIPGVRTEIWGYDGIFPGPTVISRTGRRTVIRHRNALPVPTVTHLHGGHTPPGSDGFPTDLVFPEPGPGVPIRATAGMYRMPGMSPDPLATTTIGARFTTIRWGSAPPRCGTTTTGWASPGPMSGTGWPASTSSVTQRRTRSRCPQVTGTSRS